MQPINYLTGAVDPAERLYEGLDQGLARQAKQQQLGIRNDANARAQAKETRAQELQPYAVEGAGLKNQIARDQNARANELQPMRVESAQMGLAQGRAEMAAAEAQAARQQGFQRALGDLASLGDRATFDDYQGVVAEYPEFSGAILEGWEATSEEQKRGTTKTLLQIASALKSGSVNTAETLAKNYIRAARASGDEQSAVTAEGMLMVMRSSPEAALASLGMTVSALDPDLARDVFGGAGGNVRATDILPDGSVIRVYDDKTVVTDPAGQVVDGAERQRVLEAARQAGAAEQGARAQARTTGSNVGQLETGSQARAATDLGALQVKFVENAIAAESNLASEISNYDRAIRAIQNGASAGWLDKNLPALREETAELRNAMDNLGLNVIGSVTFGALSEGELNLAMDVAVPRNLNETELLSWLVKRREAKEKVRAAVKEQANFLVNPNNTLQDWRGRVSQATERRSGGPRPSTSIYDQFISR